MLTTLIICLFCISRIIHAETPTNVSSASSPPPFVIDDELKKLSTSCISPAEHEELSGYIIRWRMAAIINHLLIKEANAMIGLEELRAVLGFAPPGKWPKNVRWPPASAEELGAAPTLEAYFDLREPICIFCSQDSEYFFEYNFPPVIAFLDKRFPTIRKIFRHKFEEILQSYAGRDIDRKAVDEMIEEFGTIRERVNDAFWEMNSYECWLARKGLVDLSSMTHHRQQFK